MYIYIQILIHTYIHIYIYYNIYWQERSRGHLFTAVMAESKVRKRVEIFGQENVANPWEITDFWEGKSGLMDNPDDFNIFSSWYQRTWAFPAMFMVQDSHVTTCSIYMLMGNLQGTQLKFVLPLQPYSLHRARIQPDICWHNCEQLVNSENLC